MGNSPTHFVDHWGMWRYFSEEDIISAGLGNSDIVPCRDPMRWAWERVVCDFQAGDEKLEIYLLGSDLRGYQGLEVHIVRIGVGPRHFLKVVRIDPRIEEDETGQKVRKCLDVNYRIGAKSGVWFFGYPVGVTIKREVMTGTVTGCTKYVCKRK